jgi:GNAT superfamily N-acetyltransferase
VAATRTTTSPILDAPRRVIALRRRVVEQIADRVEPGRWGDVVLTPSLPRVWDLNFLRVERLPWLAPGRRIDADAERRLGAEGLKHRRVICERPEVGVRLAAALTAQGWTTQPLLVMTWSGGSPPPDAGEAAVTDGSFAELREAYRWAASATPGADPESIDQLVREAERSRPALRLLARMEGQVASFCRVFSDGRTAEIDDVGTLPGHRRRGLARAVVLTAVRRALADGHDLVFLRAEERDWPRLFYARLGFAPLTRHYEFRRPV